MLTLPAAIILAVAFGHVMRHAQERKNAMVCVAAVGYLTACAFSIGAWVLVSGSPIGRPEIAFGLIGGLAWFVAYLLMDTSIRLAGLSITQCVGWLGVVVPVPAAAIFFGETPNTSQYMGLGLMLFALILLTPGESSNVTRKSKWKAPALLGVFACEGVVGMAFKGFDVSLKSSGCIQAEVDARCPGFLIFTFAAAGIPMLILAAARNRKPSRSDVGHGLALSVVAFSANYAFIAAVNRLAVPVMFPAYWAGVLLLASISAAVIWKERYKLRIWAGMAIALMTLIFVSIDVVAWLQAFRS